MRVNHVLGPCDPECGCEAFVMYEAQADAGAPTSREEMAAYLDYKAAARALMEATRVQKQAEVVFRQALDKLNRAIGAVQAP